MKELTQKNLLYQYFKEKNIDIRDFFNYKLTDKDYVENNFAFILQVLGDNRSQYFKSFFDKLNQELNTFSPDFLKEQEIEIVKTLKKLHEKLSQEIDDLNEKQKIEFKILNKKTVE